MKLNMKGLNLTNCRFGKLICIRPTSNRNNGCVIWECICDCGKNILIASDDLRNGHIKSCGCYRKEFIRKIGRTSKPYGISSLNSLYSTYKRRAKKGNLEFFLLKEEFKFITSQNCYYCGTEPKQIAKYPTYYGYYIYNGIDRVDNTKGYILDNCVACCKFCNISKSNKTTEEFLNQIEKIYLHSIKREINNE